VDTQKGTFFPLAVILRMLAGSITFILSVVQTRQVNARQSQRNCSSA
jgi:hypothetical protein